MNDDPSCDVRRDDGEALAGTSFSTSMAGSGMAIASGLTRALLA